MSALVNTPGIDPPRSAQAPAAPVAPPPWTRADAAVLAVVLGISAALVWPELFRGWYPWDDGAMGQVADRVLHGQLPHRDFDDPWTGGWSFMQAWIFQVFGTSLRMLRIPIFVAWLASLACGFRLARRFATPPVAGVATLAWGVWSLYAWHYPLLNWYYAPLALFASWGVIRFVESGRRRHLVLAGVMVGIAITFKITGLYLLAAFLLWCAMHVAYAGRHASTRGRSAGYAVLATGAGAVFVLLVVRLVLGLPAEIHGSALFLFALPSAACVAWLGWSARAAGVPAGAGVRALVALLAPLAAGMAVPLVPFAAAYVATGAVGDLVVGVFVRPAARLSMIWSPPPGRMAMAGMMLAPFMLVLGVRYIRPARGHAMAAVAVILGALAGGLAQHDQFTAWSVGVMVRSLPVMLPLVALWGSWRREEEPGPYGSVVFLLVTCAATSQLLQVPWSSLPYSLYAAPIAVLALVALLAHRNAAASPAVLFAGVFLVVAGLGHPATSAEKPDPERWARLALPRGGLLVSAQDSAMFQDVARLMAQRPAGPIHVIGDAPEFAFLSARLPVSRVIYDVLADSTAKDERLVLPLLARAGVQTVLVLNQFGRNDSLTTRQARALRREFPESRQLGRLEFDGKAFHRFVDVRWRGDSAR